MSLFILYNFHVEIENFEKTVQVSVVVVIVIHGWNEK